MIDFGGFVQTEGQPIYLQIMRYIKQGLAAGTIADGEELPSRRALSALLTVNPNTIQKAYRLLEEEGLVQSHAGQKLCPRHGAAAAGAAAGADGEPAAGHGTGYEAHGPDGGGGHVADRKAV